jgi:hypothetical protein
LPFPPRPYGQVLDELAKTHATLITANIPDVTEIPFFTSAQRIADHAGVPIEVVTSAPGIGAGDYVRVTAQGFIDKIFTGAMPIVGNQNPRRRYRCDCR